MSRYCEFCEQYAPCPCDDLDIDVCQGCGTYYSPHRGIDAWNGGAAPQLCVRCWRAHGYPWPERFDTEAPPA